MKNSKPIKINTKLIIEYIEINKLTKAEFCRQCGIAISTFNRIENGKDCMLISLFRIAKQINVPIPLLFK